MSNIVYISIFIMISILSVLFIGVLFGWRLLVKRMVKKMGKIILTDIYQENIMELLPGLQHMGVQNVLENSLRAETGDLLHRPLGSSKKWPHLDSITFIPAQTTPFPIESSQDIEMGVTIGPQARKPMKIKIPLMISGMAYGIALSEQVRLALAEAANNVGTAINSGEGGVMLEELMAARKFILQFSKSEWAKSEEILKGADMIEVKLGQGALFGLGGKISPKNLTGRAREVMGLKEDEDAVIFDNFFEDQTIEDLKELVDHLRSITGGVPIGVKMGAGGKIEDDIDHVIAMGVDYIAIDGGQAATLGAPPILSDDMGIPTLHAIVRAVNHLEKRNMKGKISLIASGGLLVPGHFLKMLALGADAVYVGSSILFAISHTQTLKALPFEPPTQVVWNQGKFKDQFKMEDGVKSAEKFLTASVEEMKTGLRAMGKRSIKELSKKDLVSYDKSTAKFIGIPFSFDYWDPREKVKENEI